MKTYGAKVLPFFVPTKRFAFFFTIIRKKTMKEYPTHALGDDGAYLSG